MKIETTLINAPADVQVSINPQTGVVSISQPAQVPPQNQNPLSLTNQPAPAQQAAATGLVNTNPAPAPQTAPLQTPFDTPKSLDLVGIIAGLAALIPVVMTAVSAFTPKPNAGTVNTTIPATTPVTNLDVEQLLVVDEAAIKQQLAEQSTVKREIRNNTNAKLPTDNANAAVRPVVAKPTVVATVPAASVIKPPAVATVPVTTPAPIIATKSAEEILAEKNAMIKKICTEKGFTPTQRQFDLLLDRHYWSEKIFNDEIDNMVLHGPAQEELFNACYSLGTSAKGINKLAFLVTEGRATAQQIAVDLKKHLTIEEIKVKYCPLQDEESFIDIEIMNAVGEIGYESDVDPEYNTNIQLWEDKVKKGATLKEIQVLAKVVLGGLKSTEVAVITEVPAVQTVEKAPEVKSKIEELIKAAEVAETPEEPFDLLKELLKDLALTAHIEPAPAVEPVKAEIGVAQNDNDEGKLPTETEVRSWSLDKVKHNSIDSVVKGALKKGGIKTIGQLLNISNTKEFADKLPKKPLIYQQDIDDAKATAEMFILKKITPVKQSDEPAPTE